MDPIEDIAYPGKSNEDPTRFSRSEILLSVLCVAIFLSFFLGGLQTAIFIIPLSLQALWITYEIIQLRHGLLLPGALYGWRNYGLKAKEKKCFVVIASSLVFGWLGLFASLILMLIIFIVFGILGVPILNGVSCCGRP